MIVDRSMDISNKDLGLNPHYETAQLCKQASFLRCGGFYLIELVWGVNELIKSIKLFQCVRICSRYYVYKHEKSRRSLFPHGASV